MPDVVHSGVSNEKDYEGWDVCMISYIDVGKAV